MKQLPLALSLNPNSTFENFFANQNNQVVLHSLQQFLCDEEPFLYLWAQVGDGVTHLLEAVQHALGEKVLCQYLPLSMLIEYPPEEILTGLEHMDLLCVDDIDALINQPQWQQAFFHLYNQLRDNHKKLIVAGHRPPAQLDLSLQDLQSRLQWGAVLYIEPLTDEEKAQALKQKANTLGLEINDEVLNFLLARVERSNAAIYKMLAQLDKASLAEKRKLTIPFVKQVLAIT